MPATHARAHDEIVREALRGPSPANARESLAYWRGRLDRLPRRRFSARREARAMVLGSVLVAGVLLGAILAALL